MGLLLVLILLSRYDKYNGFLLCLSVVLIYLTDFEPQERDWMLRSLGYAVLTAFFMFQGLSFVFRPFDSGRYHGLYANPNIKCVVLSDSILCVFGVFLYYGNEKGTSSFKMGKFLLCLCHVAFCVAYDVSERRFGYGCGNFSWLRHCPVEKTGGEGAERTALCLWAGSRVCGQFTCCIWNCEVPAGSVSSSDLV